MLTAKLECSNARLQVQELRSEVERLQGVVSQYQQELKLSNKLLMQQRLPPRPYTSSTEKALIASKQRFICAGFDECPLKVLNGGVFDSALWTIEHLEPWSRSGRHLNNRAAYCAWCASKKTRAEIAQRLHRPPSESDGAGSDGADDE